MPTSSALDTSLSYYELLGLSHKNLDDASPAFARALIKRAYHRALLKHHPDKAAVGAGPGTSTADTVRNPFSKLPSVTVDQVSAAFAVLSDPARRAEYDKALRIAAASGAEERVVFQAGVENVDLDDLEVSGADDATEWHRSCRCGNPQGYRVREQDLEEAAQYGNELMIGCADCSLWLRVHFAVLEDGGGTNNDAGKCGLIGEDGVHEQA